MEFLKQKWTYWFTTFDVNHDGFVTQKDVQHTLKYFPIVEGLSELEGKQADDKIEKWWNEHILKGRSKITVADFVNDLEMEYTQNKSQFMSRIKKLCVDIIVVLDTDHTKQFSVEKYVNIFKVWGHDNEELLRKAFEMFKPSHGIIPLQEFIDDWIIFITNTDPKKKDVVYDTYKEGLL